MSNRGALTVPTPIDQVVKQYQCPLIGVEMEETLRRIFALHMFTYHCQESLVQLDGY